MAEIPDDVMKAAYDAALDYRNDKACDPIHNDDALQIAFARAILAERERCAKLADRYAANNKGVGGQAFAAFTVATEIGHSIRK